MSPTPASLLAAALALALPAHAQQGNPGGMTPAVPLAAPGTPAPGQPNLTDRLFVHLMATGGMAEVETARLADARASAAPVRAFARRMLQDHPPVNEQLAALARDDQIAWPPRPAPDHGATLAHLQSLQGADFDRAYVQTQVAEHQKAAQLLAYEIGQGQDARLQRLAAATLPAVLDHLRHLQHLAGELSGAGPQGLAAAAAPPRRAP
ncbi:DUF4142 domain-containing protein [Ideonella sp.]|uniref:DUF4142 domain-containing protein n=1 Tax=Ideonella sp. TaxID=1929293 RepID=UPI0035B4A606